MTKKKEKSAPPVTDTKPEEAPAEAPSAAVVPEAVSPIQIPPKVLEQAKALGIDLQQIVDWAKSMEEFKNVTMANFAIIQKSFDKLVPLVKLSEQVQLAQTQGSSTTGAPAQGFNLGSLMQFLPQILGSGGGSNPLGDELTKRVIDAGVEQMFAGTKLLQAMQTKILAGLGAKEVEKALQQ